MKKKMNTEPQLTDAISPAYAKFFAEMKQHSTIDIAKWRPVHLIGYWCDLYKNHYGVEYTFKLNGSPSKSWEVLNIKKIAQQISSDPILLKGYIDYFFQNIIVAKKRRITSIALLADAITCNKYKFEHLMPGNKTIDRSTKLPSNYSIIVKKYDDTIDDYGKLAFYVSATKNSAMMSELEKAGMDVGMLGKVK